MKLTLKEIAFLAKSFEEISPISLFANINQECDGTEEKSLEAKGVYKDMEFLPPSKDVLNVVAGAQRCTRFVMNDNVFMVEKYAYRIDEKLVLAENTNGEIELNLVDNLENAIFQISEFVGVSQIKNADIEIELPVDQMLALLAMVDIYRKKALLSYTGQDGLKPTITIVEIAQQLSTPAQNSLVSMLKNNYNYSLSEAENKKNILDKLIEKKLVVFDNGYMLSDEYAFFANNFLIPETIILLETLNVEKDGRIAAATGLCVCAGIRDIASFAFGSDKIEFSSFSGRQLLQLIENYLKCPDVV